MPDIEEQNDKEDNKLSFANILTLQKANKNKNKIASLIASQTQDDSQYEQNAFPELEDID